MAIFTDHQAEVARRGSVDLTGEAQDVIKVGINNAYKRVLAETNQDLRQRTFSVASVASRATLGMPLDVRTILDVQDAANRQSLPEITAVEFDRIDPGRTETGTPTKYFTVGRFGILNPLASTGTISVVSSSTSDVTTRFVRVTGYNASGTRTSEALTVNGTTPVVSTNSYDPDEQRGIERLTKYTTAGASFVGDLTFKDSGSNIIAIVPLAYDSPTYTWIEFDQIPSAVLTYTVRAMATKPELISDYDWPEFDDQFHDILTLLASGEVLPLFGKQDLATQYLHQGNQRLQEFKNALDVKPNITHVLDNVQMQSPLGKLGQPIRGIDFGRVA